MQRNKKLKYTIAAVATTALLVTGVLFTKKCMKEDIQKRMEPEGPKKGLVTEDKRYNKKKVAKDLAKLITSVTLIEKEKDNEQIDYEDEIVRKIISLFPYEKVICDKISSENISYQRDDDLLYNILSDLEELGDEGKTEELFQILYHIESLGLEWEHPDYREIYETTGKIPDIDAANMLERLNQGLNGEVYDPECIDLIWNAMFTSKIAISQLARIWLLNELDPNILLDSVPETYRKATIELLAQSFLLGEELFGTEIPPQKFEKILTSLSKEDRKYMYDIIKSCPYGREAIGETIRKLQEIIDDTDNKELSIELSVLLEHSPIFAVYTLMTKNL